jgi:hypothetical protein
MEGKNIAMIRINGTSKFSIKLHSSILRTFAFSWIAMRAPVVTNLLLMYLITQEGALVAQYGFGIHTVS